MFEDDRGWENLYNTELSVENTSVIEEADYSNDFLANYSDDFFADRNDSLDEGSSISSEHKSNECDVEEEEDKEIRDRRNIQFNFSVVNISVSVNVIQKLCGASSISYFDYFILFHFLYKKLLSLILLQSDVVPTILPRPIFHFITEKLKSEDIVGALV